MTTAHDRHSMDAGGVCAFMTRPNDNAGLNSTASSCSERMNRVATANYWLEIPSEISNQIIKQSDALTIYLNWSQGHLPSTATAPTPVQVWIAALQMGWPNDICKLPLVDRGTRVHDGDRWCLPDASVLCRFMQSREMLQRVYDSALPVPVDIFDYFSLPLTRNAIHVAMRRVWLDMVDVWGLSDEDEAKLAILGTHWDYFQFLIVQRPILHRRYNDFFDHAALNGELNVLMKMPVEVTGSVKAMDSAATFGHLDVVQWLHANRSIGCTKDAMDLAACRGNLHVVKWLHANRNEGCSTSAMDLASGAGHLEIVKWLHDNRTEGCTAEAMNYAADNGLLAIVQFHRENRSEIDVNESISIAEARGYHDIVQYLKEFSLT